MVIDVCYIILNSFRDGDGSIFCLLFVPNRSFSNRENKITGILLAFEQARAKKSE